MKIYNELKQGTEEWKAVRLGKFTASDFHHLLIEIIDTRKLFDERENKPRKSSNLVERKKTLSAGNRILLRKASERITGNISDSEINSIHIDRGNQGEKLAIEAYAITNMCEVTKVGFIELSEFVGCSPDGLVGEDGGVEIKCPDNHGYLDAVNSNYINPEHKTQMQFCMYVTGRKWWDYVLYNDNFSKSLHVERVVRDEKQMEIIARVLIECEFIVQEYINNFNKGE